MMSGMFWLTVANLSAKIFAFIAIILIARILGKVNFGEFGLIRTTITTFVAISGYGIGISATKFIAELLNNDRERIGRIIGLGYLTTVILSFLLSLFFFILSPYICEKIINVPHLVTGMRLGTVSLFLLTFIGMQTGILTGFQHFKGIAVANLCIGIITVPLFVYGAWLANVNGTLIGMVILYIINIVTNGALIYRTCRHYKISYSFCDSYKEISILWKYNIPNFLGVALISIVGLVCQFIVVSQISDLSELGIYYAAAGINTIQYFIPLTFMNICLPLLCESKGQGNLLRFYNISRKMLLMTLSISLLIVFPFLFFSKTILLIYGVGFTEGWYFVHFFCAVLIVNSFTGPIGNILLSIEKVWSLFFLNLIYCLVYFLTIICLVHWQYGIVSLVIGQLCAYIAMSLGSMIYLKFINNEFSKVTTT
jgi:O-antigen/teichoic acid export membrane protein